MGGLGCLSRGTHWGIAWGDGKASLPVSNPRPLCPTWWSPCAKVLAAPDSTVSLSPSVSLHSLVLLVDGCSLLQPADPPDVCAEESDLRLCHRLHHQCHAHRSQPGAAQRHEIGTAGPICYIWYPGCSTPSTTCSPPPLPAPQATIHHPPSTNRGIPSIRAWMSGDPTCLTHRPCMELWSGGGGPGGGSKDSPRLLTSCLCPHI